MRIMWSSQSPEPGALSLFIGGLGSVPCEGLVRILGKMRRLKRWCLVLGVCSWERGFMKCSGAWVVIRLCGERRVSSELRNVMPF